jgi:hypothetical protein
VVLTASKCDLTLNAEAHLNTCHLHLTNI